MGRERREEEDPIPVQDPTKTGGNVPVSEGEEYDGDAEEDDQDDDDDDGEEEEDDDKE